MTDPIRTSRNEQSPREKALAVFMEWFRTNYPGPDTIIHKPDWHAPKVFRAVEYALKDAGIIPSETRTNSDPGTEKLLRDLLDRAYKMMEMSGYRVAEHNPDHNNPIIAWMADARSVLYGNTKPHPDLASLK